MSSCRFMHQNLITSPEMLAVSSALPGAVGMPAPRAAGSAIAYAGGQHSASRDQAFLLEIDSVAAGAEVGLATFRWKRSHLENWEASGLATSTSMTALADGVSVKWVSGIGDDFAVGDGWTIVCPANEGPVRLLDGDRDTVWTATGCANEHLTVDLGSAMQATSLILADHNLTDSTTVRLMADDAALWTDPAFSATMAVTRPHMVAFFDQTRRYWRLEISDPANSNGYISAGMFHLGPHLSPSRNFSARYSRTLAAGRQLNVTDAGKVAGSAKALGHSFELPFSGLNDADTADLEQMLASVHDTEAGRLRPLFFTPLADDPAGTYYCLPGAELALRGQHQGRWSASLILEEVVRTNV